MTLSDLTTQFTAMLNRRDLTPTLATYFITQAILRIQRELRTPMMEKTIDYTFDDTYVASKGLLIPNDYLQLIGLFPDGDEDATLDRVSMSKAKKWAQYGDIPKVYARIGGYWVIGPAPSAGSSMTIQYYASFAPLVQPTDTNILLQVAWDLPLYGALSMGCDYFSDKRGDGFEKRYTQIRDSLQSMADEDELTAEAVVQPAYAWPDEEF